MTNEATEYKVVDNFNGGESDLRHKTIEQADDQLKVPGERINFENIVPRFDVILARGLCWGLGCRDGQMCIEAAICAAMDLPHGDNPNCVSASVRAYKIALNDSGWSSPAARAAGLRNLGIAQIGSKGVVDDLEFTARLCRKTIQVLIPSLFRTLFADDAHGCLTAASKCEQSGSTADAAWAADAARDAWDAWDAMDADAARAARVAWAARVARSEGAAWAARAADAARAACAADAAWDARAACAADAARAADAAWADKYLLLSAGLALDVLRELNSPGCVYLDSISAGGAA